MILSDLQAEFQARGFDYLSTTRQTYYLNSGYQVDICEDADWPFLETTTTGTAPLTITDLRTVESVIDTTVDRKLRPLDRRNITDDFYDGDLTMTGTPEYYYITTATIVAVFPANTTDSLSVRYWKFPTALAAAGDTPVVPTRFQSLIVDAAVARAYEDSDEYEAAQVAWTQLQVRLEQMKSSLLVGQHDEPDDLILSYAPDTDL